jgi:hypothetical protein
MMDFIPLIFGLLSVEVLGWSLSRLILGKKDEDISAAVGFPIGSSVYTLTIFIVDVIFGQRLDQITGLSILIILLIGSTCISLFRVGRPEFKTPKLSDWPASERIIVVIIIWLCASSWLASFNKTVVDWDAITLFDYRARIIFQTGFISDTYARSSPLSYPLHTSLLHWLTMILGWNTPMPVYPLFFTSLVSSIYFLTRKLVTNKKALLLALLVSVAPKIFDNTLIAYANLPYAVYFVLGSLFLYIWTKKSQKEYFIVGVVLSLLSLWVRVFPFFLVPMASAIYSYRKNFSIGRLLLAIALVSLAILALGLQPENISKSFDVIKWGVIQYYLPSSLLSLSFIYGYSAHKKSPFWIWTLFGLITLMVLGSAYYYQQNPVWLEQIDAIQRMAMFYSPVLALSLLPVFESPTKDD